MIVQHTGNEIVQNLVKTGISTIQLEAGSKFLVGGTGLNLITPLNLDISTNGIGGLDTGVVTLNSIYNVFIVVSGISFGLVASLGNSPLGFPQYKLLGGLSTNALSNILGTSTKKIGSVGDVKKSRLTEDQFINENGVGWVMYDGRNIAGSRLATITGNNVLEDARGIFLRGKNNGRVDGNENPDGELALGSFQGHETAPASLAVNGSTNSTGNHAHQSRAKRWGSISAMISDALRDVNYLSAGYNGSQGGPSPIFTVNTNGSIATGTHSHTVTNSITGGNETRAKNLTVNIYIKIN